MKTIYYRSETDSISARCHLLITEQDENVETIVAAGLIDVDSASRAMAARIVKGGKRRFTVYDTGTGSTVFSDLKQSAYRFWQSAIGSRKGGSFTTHVLVLHK